MHPLVLVCMNSTTGELLPGMCTAESANPENVPPESKIDTPKSEFCQIDTPRKQKNQIDTPECNIQIDTFWTNFAVLTCTAHISAGRRAVGDVYPLFR